MYEFLIKRTLYISQCECGDRDERVADPPKERQCKCGRWVPYVEQTYTGPELKK